VNQLRDAAERAVRILGDLIAFSSVSGGGNREIAGYIEEYLRSCGLSPRRIPAARDAASCNVFATIGPGVDGGLLLSGHTDVVPAAAEEWGAEPFELRQEETADGRRLYGRGTADMKGFLACLLAMVPQWVEAGEEDRVRPLHLAFTYDEEIGCIGVDNLIAEFGRSLPSPEAVIVGEPTELRPVLGHKGSTGCRTLVSGRAAHSSRPEEGVNAIYAAAEIVGEIRRMAAEVKAGTEDAGTPELDTAAPDTPEAGSSPDVSPASAAGTSPPGGSENASAGEGAARLFDPPHSTFSVGTISGGSARNVVADSCEIVWEIRTLPWEEPGPYVERIREFCRRELAGLTPAGEGREKAEPDARQGPQCSTEVTVSFPGLVPNAASKARQYYRAMETGSGRTVKDPQQEEGSSRERGSTEEPAAVPFGTEAGKYARGGVPALVWGPGSITQAHRKNEFIYAQQLRRCCAMLGRL
jgi:acetylornithine deacetylase